MFVVPQVSFYFHILRPQLDHFCSIALANVCVATGAKPPAKEGEREAEVWPQAKEAGGERGRVPPSERKTGLTNKCERFFTFWFR